MWPGQLLRQCRNFFEVRKFLINLIILEIDVLSNPEPYSCSKRLLTSATTFFSILRLIISGELRTKSFPNSPVKWDNGIVHNFLYIRFLFSDQCIYFIVNVINIICYYYFFFSLLIPFYNLKYQLGISKSYQQVIVILPYFSRSAYCNFIFSYNNEVAFHDLITFI